MELVHVSLIERSEEDQQLVNLIEQLNDCEHAFVIRDSGKIVGFFNLQPIVKEIYQLEKMTLLITKQPEKVIEIFYHALEKAECLGAKHVQVYSDHQHVRELLDWIGFTKDSTQLNTWIYQCG
ncbi:hypothetical protein SAMN04488134_10577 [Amphibacillus marinus]|uniref:N-acetyltransferase domain-containing protein n=1 Tax=Amphibacillus marinus TaxID=872970 RepID=A0A1H8N0D4_9BACI|nr:hypothetical protein [Amphibacillus marinus]SEO23111.1 hypothetical protein SAMN04488134_10577 [Amphibacillus marinus]